MAEVKGITIPIRGDATELTKALNKIRYEAREVDKELGYINKALKLDPKNLELVRQKMTVLNQAAKDNEDKIKNMKKALEEMKAAGVSDTSAEYRELQREIVKAEANQKKYNAELKELERSTSKLGQASAKMQEFGNKATQAGQALKGLSMAAAAVDAAIAALAVKSGKAADELITLSKTTGISTDDLQKYKAAADLVDVSVEPIAKSQNKIKATAYQAAQGTGTAAEAYAKLGVSVVNADGELRQQDAIFTDVIQALGQMENETERDAIAMQIFGKSASELNPLIEDGGETYKRVAEIFANNGLEVVDAETLQKANEFNDSLDTIKATWGAAITQIGTKLAAYLAPAVEKIAQFLEKVAGWLSKLSPQALTIIGIIAGVVAALAPALLIIGKIAFAISSIMTLLPTIGPIIAAVSGPIGIVVAAIAGLIAVGVLLYKNWDTIKEKAAQVVAWVVDKWNALKDALASIGARIVENITAPIKNAFEIIKAIVQKIKDVFSNLNIQFPHIKTPHFSVQPPGWSIGDLLKGIIPRLGIEWYKTGGIFNSPQVIGVGEAGPEAVIPIDKLREVLGGVGGITVNVYGSDNMSVDELALKVQERIITLQNRRAKAWA